MLRLALGLALFPHGAQKLLGWFGGPGFEGAMGHFASLGIPAVFGLLAVIAEFFGSLGLIVGLLGRVAAFGVACVMVVAAALQHLRHGFFMNWTGQQAGEGFEYHVLAVGIALAIMITGSGALSVDEALSRRSGGEP